MNACLQTFPFCNYSTGVMGFTALHKYSYGYINHPFLPLSAESLLHYPILTVPLFHGTIPSNFTLKYGIQGRTKTEINIYAVWV